MPPLFFFIFHPITQIVKRIWCGYVRSRQHYSLDYIWIATATSNSTGITIYKIIVSFIWDISPCIPHSQAYRSNSLSPDALTSAVYIILFALSIHFRSLWFASSESAEGGNCKCNMFIVRLKACFTVEINRNLFLSDPYVRALCAFLVTIANHVCVYMCFVKK